MVPITAFIGTLRLFFKECLWKDVLGQIANNHQFY